MGTGEDYVEGFKVLKVDNCSKIIVAGIVFVLDVCKFLEYFDVRSCLYIISVGFDEVGVVFFESCKVNFNGSLIEFDVLIWVFNLSVGIFMEFFFWSLRDMVW